MVRIEHLSEIESIPPCRIYRPGPDGEMQLIEVMTERPRMTLEFQRTDIRPTIERKAPTIFAPIVKGRARAQERPRKASKASRADGHYTRRPDIEPRAILERMRAGEEFTAIYASYGVRRSRVSTLFHRALAANEGMKREYEALLVCGCGKVKRSHAKICGFCARNERDREERAAARIARVKVE